MDDGVESINLIMDSTLIPSPTAQDRISACTDCGRLSDPAGILAVSSVVEEKRILMEMVRTSPSSALTVETVASQQRGAISQCWYVAVVAVSSIEPQEQPFAPSRGMVENGGRKAPVAAVRSISNGMTSLERLRLCSSERRETRESGGRQKEERNSKVRLALRDAMLNLTLLRTTVRVRRTGLRAFTNETYDAAIPKAERNPAHRSSIAKPPAKTPPVIDHPPTESGQSISASPLALSPSETD